MSYDSSVKAKEVALDTLFQTLGDRTRLRLLNLMEGGEVCVCFLVEILEAPQPKISRHLAYLRRAGLVEARRDGKWMSYSLAGALSALVPANGAKRSLFDLAAMTHGDRDLPGSEIEALFPNLKALIYKAFSQPNALPRFIKRQQSLF